MIFMPRILTLNPAIFPAGLNVSYFFYKKTKARALYSVITNVNLNSFIHSIASMMNEGGVGMFRSGILFT